MKHTIFLSAAAVLATAFFQPLEAGSHGGGGGGHGGGGSMGGSRGGGGGMRESRPAQAPSRPAFAFGGGIQGNNNRAPTVQPSPRQQPTFAFGGSNNRGAAFQASPRTDRSIAMDGNRRFGSTQFNRNNFGHSRPPADVFRNWDHRRFHTWNHHTYRWYNNDWVIFDDGYDPDYYYDDANPDYDVNEYSDDLAAEVQQELSRRGYDPGVVDGVLGQQTRDAIAAYQRDNGLSVTGRIDLSLLRKMGM